MKLTAKQKKFADYYIETLNAKQSYIKAGYKTTTGNSAEVCASKLLRNAKVDEYIAKAMKEKDQERIMSQDEVLEYLTRVARGKEKEQIIKLDNDGNEIEISVPPALKERTKCAELLGRRYKLFTDKIEHDVSEKKALTIIIGGEEQV